MGSFFLLKDWLLSQRASSLAMGFVSDIVYFIDFLPETIFSQKENEELYYLKPEQISDKHKWLWLHCL
jgi:hypothetical protein